MSRRDDAAVPHVAAGTADLAQRFDVVTTACDVGGRAFAITHPRSAEALIDEAAFARDERLPYWADVWPSARVLARHLVRHQGDGREAIELGCGSGLVACALAAAGYRVTATDYDEDALAFTRLNVAANVGAPIATRRLDWRALPESLPAYDVVVAADVLYERPFAEPVARAVARLVRPSGYALVADPGRVAFEPFLTRMRTLGFTVREGWDVDHAEAGQRHTIRLRVLAPGSTTAGGVGGHPAGQTPVISPSKA
jgi:predicted nicotinamide N-methyase